MRWVEKFHRPSAYKPALPRSDANRSPVGECLPKPQQFAKSTASGVSKPISSKSFPNRKQQIMNTNEANTSAKSMRKCNCEYSDFPGCEYQKQTPAADNDKAVEVAALQSSVPPSSQLRNPVSQYGLNKLELEFNELGLGPLECPPSYPTRR